MQRGSDNNGRPIDPLDYDVARLANSAVVQADPMLETLARLSSDPGGPMPWVYLLVSGSVIVGRLCADIHAATAADEALLTLARQARLQTDQEDGQRAWDEVIEQFEDGFLAKKVADERADAAATRRRVSEQTKDEEFRISDLPPDLARRVLRAERAEVLTLTTATVEPPRGPRYNVGVIRVRTADVSVWWIDPEQSPPE